MMSGLCKRIGIIGYLLVLAILNANASNGSQEVKIESVRFKTGYAHSSGGYNLSIYLQPYPSNGKSCQVVFGDMGPNKALTKNAPASCEDLQLTTTSSIGVQVLSTDDNQFKVAWVVVYTEDGGRFDVNFGNTWYTNVAPGINLVKHARYEDPNTAKILAKIENVETKIDNAVTELKSKIYRYRYKGK